MTQAPSRVCLGLSQPPPRMAASEAEFCFLFGRKEPAWESPELPDDQSESSLFQPAWIEVSPF